MLSTSSLNVSHCLSYKHFPLSPCFVHRVDTKPRDGTGLKSPPFYLKKYFFSWAGTQTPPPPKITSCFTIGLYLRTLRVKLLKREGILHIAYKKEGAGVLSQNPWGKACTRWINQGAGWKNVQKLGQMRQVDLAVDQNLLSPLSSPFFRVKLFHDCKLTVKIYYAI